MSSKPSQPDTDPRKTDKTRLKDMPYFFINENEFPDQLEKGIYSMNDGFFEYDCLYSPGKENRLFVLLSGDADREKFSPPVFQRWSWAKHFPGHCLYISDPTLKLHDEVGLAWYIGTKDVEPLSKIADIIQKVANVLGISLKDVVLYGSSGGGFAALQLSAILQDVITVAINPQTDLSIYKNSRVDKLLNLFFDDISREEAVTKYGSRFNIKNCCDKLLHNKIFYVQNTLDKHHYNVQYPVFAKEIGLELHEPSKINNIETMFFEHPDGHKKAETPEVFQLLIEKIIEMTC